MIFSRESLNHELRCLVEVRAFKFKRVTAKSCSKTCTATLLLKINVALGIGNRFGWTDLHDKRPHRHPLQARFCLGCLQECY